jgi:hypothetical protein
MSKDELGNEIWHTEQATAQRIRELESANERLKDALKISEFELKAAYKAWKDGLEKIEQLESAIKLMEADCAGYRKALEVYAKKEHMFGMEEWEAPSGEPVNILCPPNDEPWMVEDGTLARQALSQSSGASLLKRMEKLEKVAKDANEIFKDSLVALDDGFKVTNKFLVSNLGSSLQALEALKGE